MPSEKILAQKQQVVAELTEKIKSASSGVIVNYSGITVADDTALRAALRKAGVEYSVYKNSTTGRACENAGYGELKNVLEGMTAIAISNDDPVAPAKILKEYAEKIETFELKGGFVDGGVLDQKGVEALAAIPSKPILVGKMLGSLQKSLYGLAYVLQAKIDKENGGAEAPAEA
ncbi:MAG: 50S ribosomal protein L10 [Clostridia bacterium]|nr:50S ribosomal protein L10 [Clostridia bacterium]